MDNDRIRELLERVGRQDQAAFRELYKAFSRRVFAYVLNMVKDHGRAEEILVDTMYEVWRAPARFRGDSQFGTWLIGIARNKALMAYRAQGLILEKRIQLEGWTTLVLRKPSPARGRTTKVPALPR